MAKVFLTDNLVRTAFCPEGKNQEIFCDGPKDILGKIRNGSAAGLGLRVTAQGAKSFVHAYRFNGKQKRHVIGNPDSMNVSSARLLVQQRNLDVENGRDPALVEKVDFRQKHGETLGEVIESYMAQSLSRTSTKHRSDFARMIAPWLHVPSKISKNPPKIKKRIAIGEELRQVLASEITPRHIAPYLNQIKSDHVANSTLKHLKAMFNWAIRMQILDMRNPCDALAKRKILKKRRNYTPEQVREIARHVFNPPLKTFVDLSQLSGAEKRNAALRAGQATTEHEALVELCHYMGILFLTMARPVEVRNAKFEHFDLKQLVWNKHNTKGIKLSKAAYEYEYRSVPIHLRVAEIIRRQREKWPDSDYVFPNHLNLTEPRDNFRKSLKSFKKLDGVPEHFQLYDLKRMAISMMMMGQGVRREDVSHYVDHKGNLETTLIYDLGFVDPMRPVAAKLGEILGLD